MMDWSKEEVNHVRVSLDRCDAQGLGNELGKAKNNVVNKIREIKNKDRISKLCKWIRD